MSRGRAYRRHQRKRAIWHVLRRWRNWNFHNLGWWDYDDQVGVTLDYFYDLQDPKLWSAAGRAVNHGKWRGELYDSPPRNKGIDWKEWE